MRKLFILVLVVSVFSCKQSNEEKGRNTSKKKQEEVKNKNIRGASSLLEEYLNDTNVLVIAHRADWRYASENSILAIENAIKMGVDIVEIDLKRTEDGQIVLMHDHTNW